MSSELTPGSTEEAVVDYKAAAGSLARAIVASTGRPPNEALTEIIQEMSDSQAQTYFEALAASTEAAASI